MILYSDVNDGLEKLNQRSQKISQSIQDTKHFNNSYNDRRSTDRRLLSDRRDGEQGPPHENRDLRRQPRRSDGDRRLQSRERLELLQHELSTVMSRQMALKEGTRALSMLEADLDISGPNFSSDEPESMTA